MCMRGSPRERGRHRMTDGMTREGESAVRVTVCLATRNRGEAIGPTLASLLELDHESFEVVIVDQSEGDTAVRTFRRLVGTDDRFTFLQSDTVGLSVARNIATAVAHGEILAFTDDDCVVPKDWLGAIEELFTEHPEVMMICGAVLAGDHDPAAGAIPTFTPSRFQTLRSPWTKFKTRGIGANLAVRATALRRVGPFDEVLGAGGALKSCEDGDMEYRFLRAGLPILDAPHPAVVHSGFRTWAELRPLSRGALMACGATCMKHLRLHDPAILPTLVYLWLARTVRWNNAVRFRRPIGASLFYEFARGMIVSFRYRVDPRTGTYVMEPKTAGLTGRAA
jgi:glycosyltransferase involved in cell wall biosynthesis